MENPEPTTPIQEEESDLAAKRDPFVTLRIVVIVFVPLIVIMVVSGLDQKFFSLFQSDPPAKTQDADQDTKRQSAPAKSLSKPYRLKRTSKPPP